MASNINDFLAAFSSDPKFALHLPVLWTVSIDGVTMGSINTVLSEAGEKWQAKISPFDMTMGTDILVAQAVTLPNESSSFDAPSMDSMGGFLPGYVLQKRANFLERSFSVNFLETQMDIEHNFFRPWAIAVGIKGLVETGESIKGSMEVKQFTNSGQLMKGFRFNKIFPTTIESFTLDYDSADFKIKAVTFACQNYEQL